MVGEGRGEGGNRTGQGRRKGQGEKWGRGAVERGSAVEGGEEEWGGRKERKGEDGGQGIGTCSSQKTIMDLKHMKSGTTLLIVRDNIGYYAKVR